MNEKLIEKKLCAAVKRLGGAAIKIWCASFTGMPDRLILLPGGRVAFTELKSTGGVLRPRQKVVIAWLRGLGFEVRVIDSLEGLEDFINFLQYAF